LLCSTLGMASRPARPNPENCSRDELRTAALATPTRASYDRMMAIQMLLANVSVEQVAAAYRKLDRTIRNWIRRFNERGIDGLIEGKSPGAPRKISQEQCPQYRQLVEQPQQAGEQHWTARKFHGYLREVHQLEVGYSTVVRWLHEQGFRLKVPQPWPDRQDETLREAFRERLRDWLEDEETDLWYLDEMGVEGDPRPRRRWAQKGSKPRVTKNGEHMRMNVCGMVCPRTGQFYALEFTHSDSEVFQRFLEEANQDVTLDRARNLLICDNASWHKRKSTDWSAFEPVFLPPYLPDLNPIERLWLILKAEWFCDFVAKTRENLIQRLDEALNWLINRREDNQRTCSIGKII